MNPRPSPSDQRRQAERQQGLPPGRGERPAQRRAPFRLAQELRRRIECGIYEQGDWLPIEQALLLEFPVSRTVLREAIIILECQGLIVSHHGLGNRVVARQRLEDKTVIQSIDALGFLEACLFFEVEAAVLAAGLSRADTVLELSNLTDEPPLESCHRFHTRLAQAAQNRLVSVSIRNLWDLALSQPAIGKVLNAALSRASDPIPVLQSHVRDAVNAGDPDLTRHRLKALFGAYMDAVLNLDEQRLLSEAQSRSHALRLSWTQRLANEKGGPQRRNADRLSSKQPSA